MERNFISLYEMNHLTINIDLPTGMAIDLNSLEVAANDFVRKYIGEMGLYDDKKSMDAKSTAAFRTLRGVMSSDKSYKEMLEEALMEKYSL